MVLDSRGPAVVVAFRAIECQPKTNRLVSVVMSSTLGPRMRNVNAGFLRGVKLRRSRSGGTIAKAVSR